MFTSRDSPCAESQRYCLSLDRPECVPSQLEVWVECYGTGKMWIWCCDMGWCTGRNSARVVVVLSGRERNQISQKSFNTKGRRVDILCIIRPFPSGVQQL